MTPTTHPWDAEAYHAASDPQEAWGREVLERLDLKGDEVILERGGKSERLTGGFFKALDQHLRPLRTVSVPGLPPLTGGAVGYVGYDGVRWIEKLPDRHSRETSLADAEFQ